ATENQPFAHTDVAVRDVGAVVDHILARRGVAKINLLGWSWGTVIMATYTAQNNAKVERLALYAPAWIRQTPALIATEGRLGAYRTVTAESAKTRWLSGVAPDKQKDLIPADWFETWWRANMASDAVGAAQNPPVVRAPNGVIEDSRNYWSAGKAYYDPAAITVPVLLVHAAGGAGTPAYMSQALFPRLANAQWKRYVVIGEGTHTVVMEKNRMQLFREVQLFLEEGR